MVNAQIGVLVPLIVLLALMGCRDSLDPVVRSDTDAVDTTDVDVDTRTDVEPDSDIGTDDDTDADTEPDTDADTEPDTDADTEPDTEADTEPDTEADTEPDTDADTEPWVRPDRPDVSTAPAAASWRYGGGVGYPDRIDPSWPIVTRVRTRAQLTAALDAAAPGDVVYVDDTAAIDLTGTWVCVPEGVTLASGRGVGGRPGGKLFSTDIVPREIVRVCGDDVRITGLRILGIDAGECPDTYPSACSQPDRTGGRNCRDCEPRTVGIKVSGHDGLEVDNNEIAGWGLAGVAFSASVDGHVHHNDIHHTQRQGLGYGVLLGRGGDDVVVVEVDHNRFDYNRHVIAGSGEPGQDYDAHHNIVHPNQIGHVFDMHGHNENTDNGSRWAGGDIRIHHNTVLDPSHYALVVRGEPQHGSWLYDNCLSRTTPGNAALQRHFYGSFWLDQSPSGSSRPNQYGQTVSSCETLRWCVSNSGDGPWRNVNTSGASQASVRVHDVDGDGLADVLSQGPSGLRWSRSTTSSWASRAPWTDRLDTVVFHDFDGDGAVDALRTTGTHWQWSPSASTSWQQRNTSGYTLDRMVFGDFDGDGATDILAITGGQYKVSLSASTSWQSHNATTVPLDELLIGDFDGDGTDDALRGTGSEWQMSAGASGPWTRRLGSRTDPSLYIAADVDGDGQDDVIRRGNNRWYVSYGAETSWQELRISDDAVTSVWWADVDGDGADDAFRTRCPH